MGQGTDDERGPFSGLPSQGQADKNRDSAAAFSLTRWSEVARAQSRDESIAFAAQTRLVTTYQGPLLRHLSRRYRVDEDQARDWLQAFVYEQILQRGLFLRAKRKRGRLRNFLRRALDRFVISAIRREHAFRRSPTGGLVSLNELPEAAYPGMQGHMAWAFDVDWVRTLLARVLEAMEAECREKGVPQRWGLFKARWVDPLLDGDTGVSYAELVVRFGFRSPTEAHNTWITAARMFRRILEETLEEDEGTADTVAGGIEDFIVALRAAAKQGSLERRDAPESGSDGTG